MRWESGFDELVTELSKGGMDWVSVGDQPGVKNKYTISIRTGFYN